MCREDFSDYLESLTRLFHAARVLETWYSIFAPGLHLHHDPTEPPPAVVTLPGWCTAIEAEKVLDRLRVMTQFLRGYVCAFAIHDLGVLHSAYIKNVREWLTD